MSNGNTLKMKDMKKIISFILACVTFGVVGCSKSGEDVVSDAVTTDTVSAEIIDIDTKTSLDGVKMTWCEGDALCVTVDPSVSSAPFDVPAHRFDISSGTGTAQASFRSNEVLTGTNWSAVYPFDLCSVKSGEKYIYIDFPSVQEYVENGIADGIVPLYATGTNPANMKFTYGSGILRIKLYDAVSAVPVKVSRIEVTTDVPASGMMVVTPGNSRFPFAHNGKSTQTVITYNVPEIKLSNSSVKPTAFNICLASSGRVGMTAYSSLEIKVYASNGAVFSKTKADFKVEGGKIYNFPPLQFDGTVSYKVGDYYPDPNVDITDTEAAKTVEGLVFSVTDGGAHGKIVSLVESSGLKWNATGGGDATLDEDDGAVNWNKIKAKDADFSDYPAFAWCASLGEGWYIPAINELVTLRSAWGATAAEKEAFNKRISDVGGTPLKMTATDGGSAKSAYYYSSTEKESAANKALSLSFNSTSGASDGIKKASDSQANLIFRAIKKF